MPNRQRKNEKTSTHRGKNPRPDPAPKNPSKKAAARTKNNKSGQPGIREPHSRDNSNTYRDLRSASVPHKRDRARKCKYYNFSVVDAGRLRVPCYRDDSHHSVQAWPDPRSEGHSDLSVVGVTKKPLYHEAQRTALMMRHKHHRCTLKNYKYLVKNAQRHEIEARRIARGLNSHGRSWDYSGLEAQCLDDYVKEPLSYVRTDDGQGRDTVVRWGYDDSEASLGCLCDNCVWARHGWVPPEGDEGYGGVGTKTSETEEPEEYADWLETFFDQTSRLVDVEMEERGVLVERERSGLGWVDAGASQEELLDVDVDATGWFAPWTPDWIDWPSIVKTESESSFEMV